MNQAPANNPGHQKAQGRRPVRPPIHNCDECQHFHHQFDSMCALDHKQRFILPNATLRGLEGGRWGWRRRCEDFSKKQDGK